MASHGHSRIVSPEHFPIELRALFDELTGPNADVWGLSAAIALSQFKKHHSRSPSFAEYFDAVLILREFQPRSSIDWSSVPSPVLYSFRHHVAVHWRRLGWISWSREPHSLRHGKAFRKAATEWKSHRTTA